ncbi:MAG: EAL domain-containing protein [Halochromatium sp.]
MAARLATSPRRHSRPFLGLRWKVLLGISLPLAAVIISLTFYAHEVLIGQFERHQGQLRQRQVAHFSSLLADRYQQLSRLASLVPRLTHDGGDRSVVEHLRQALEIDGATLDLEWDIRSVHWVPPRGEPVALWPPDSEALPRPLVGEVQGQPERVLERLLCEQEACLQYLASPVLWRGETAGSLVLGRTMASLLLAFRDISQADLVLATPSAIPGTLPGATAGTTPGATPDATPSTDDRARTSTGATQLRFLGATQAERMLPLLRSVPAEALRASRSDAPLTVQFGRDWYQVFRVNANAKGLIGFIINRTTDDRRTIERLSQNSLLIGLLALFVAEILLLLIMQSPVTRIRQLSRLLPLLAENRFDALAERLPRSRHLVGLRDEIDETIAVASTLNQRMAQMQAERQAAQRKLQWLANHDSLTLLLNRRGFDLALAEAIQQAQQDGSRGALLFIDLDSFKDVNDTSGHPIGDRLLKRIGKKLSATLGERMRVGRLGGDEFAVLVNDTDQAATSQLCQRILALIKSTRVRAGAHCHQVTASIGIALFPEHGADTETLMANADLAMYQAKAQQHRSYHVYAEQDKARARANARVLWGREITAALNASRLQLYYQPLMELSTRRIWRAEGLLRIKLVDGRLAFPDEFIPIAERSALINAIDRWVIGEAIRLLVKHPALSLSVNLSAKALADTSLDADLARLLQSARIEPSRLTLEITETVAIENIGGAIARMKSIRAFGCHFALDDFGSGFASYAYLKELPVDDVKIDGSMIRNLDQSVEDRIFVKAVVEMAHNMGKKVVAEFVDSALILEILRDIGVDFAQGYFIGRPLPQPPAT